MAEKTFANIILMVSSHCMGTGPGTELEPETRSMGSNVFFKDRNRDQESLFPFVPAPFPIPPPQSHAV